MTYEFIDYKKADNVATVTMNRPERLNALIVPMGLEILAALSDSEQDDEVRAVVLTGAGRSFCAGDDMKGDPTTSPPLSSMLADPLSRYAYGPGRWVTIVRHMMRLPKPVVGVINGHAHGAGFNLALGCDFRIMSEKATMCVPFVKWGMATGTNRLHQFVGIGKALEWAMLGKTILPLEAERWGLVTMVVPEGELKTAALEFTERIAQAPTQALAATKAAIYRGWDRDPDIAYEYQGLAQHLVRDTDDRAEGRDAFREKRSPRFKGK